MSKTIIYLDILDLFIKNGIMNNLNNTFVIIIYKSGTSKRNTHINK